jgi:hypothetical protein
MLVPTRAIVQRDGKDDAVFVVAADGVAEQRKCRSCAPSANSARSLQLAGGERPGGGDRPPSADGARVRHQPNRDGARVTTKKAAIRDEPPCRP